MTGLAGCRSGVPRRLDESSAADADVTDPPEARSVSCEVVFGDCFFGTSVTVVDSLQLSEFYSHRPYQVTVAAS